MPLSAELNCPTCHGERALFCGEARTIVGTGSAAEAALRHEALLASTRAEVKRFREAIRGMPVQPHRDERKKESAI